MLFSAVRAQTDDCPVCGREAPVCFSGYWWRSADSRCFQSTCGAYELLYWHGRSGKQIISDQRNQVWDTYTSTLGISVMGIWQDGSDGTDINALDRSHRQVRFAGEDPLAGEHPVVVTSGDDGAVRLFNYPCVVEDAPNRKYIGHSSHVMMARFAVFFQRAREGGRLH